MNVAAHWEKLVLAAALMALLAVVGLKLVGGADIPALAPANAADALSSNVYLADYATVLSRARTNVPVALVRDGMTHPSLQYCPQCKGLHPLFSVKCPECGATVDYGEDFDKDGVPNKWEMAYELNWHDKADAASDPDKDGLDNLAEFKRESDPTNPVSPNVVADEYTVAEVYRPVRPVVFQNVNKTAAGYLFSVVCKGRYNTVKEGGTIKEGQVDAYQAGKFTEKKTNVVMKGGITKTLDVSELAMKDLVRKEEFTMVLKATNYMAHLEAKVTRKSDSTATNVVVGTELQLDAVKKAAKVEALDDQRKACVFKVGGIAYEVTVGN